LDTDSFYQLIILILLLVISALFSGSEVALFSLDPKKLEEEKSKSKLIFNYITSLIESPHRLLVTILLGNTLVNVAASIVAVTFAVNFAKINNLSIELVLTLQIILLTIFIILISEIIPKIWASKYPLKFARIVAVPLYWTAVLIYPISKIVTDFLKFLISKVKLDRSKTMIREGEIAELASLGAEQGTIEEEEEDLIHGIVAFRSISVKEIMTPRVDIEAVPLNSNFEDLLKIITNSGKSRLPLYDEDLDDILGIIYAKDLLRFINNSNPDEMLNIKKIARKPYFVPENKLISELLKEFQAKNLHLGIVVDEYGGTSGLVSMEDILEEIVGEIRDEFDKEEVEFTELGEGKYLAYGKMSIIDLNEELEADFSSTEDDYETLGGFIFNYAGTIPDAGYSFIEKGFKFTVKTVKDKRIEQVVIEKVESGK